MRAYVSEIPTVNMTQVSKGLTINDVEIKYGIKNSGQSPASNITVDVNEFLFPGFKGDNGNIGLMQESECSSDTVGKLAFGLGAGQEIFYLVGKQQFMPNSEKPSDSTLHTKKVDAFAPDLVKMFEKGNTILVILGSICYTDIFAIKHRTNFCYQYFSQKDFLNSLSTPCPYGNTAD